jgi:hypothetical protein
MRGIRNRQAIANASLLFAFCASLLFILTIVLDWVNLRPGGYQLAGSTAPSVRKLKANPSNPPQDMKK